MSFIIYLVNAFFQNEWLVWTSQCDVMCAKYFLKQELALLGITLQLQQYLEKLQHESITLKDFLFCLLDI